MYAGSRLPSKPGEITLGLVAVRNTTQEGTHPLPKRNLKTKCSEILTGLRFSFAGEKEKKILLR